MKKLLFVILFFASVCELKSQTFPDVPSIKTYIEDSIVRSRLLNALSFQKPFLAIQRYLPDIIQDTANITSPYHGMLRYQRKDSTSYWYDTIGVKRWRPSVIGGSGGGSITSVFGRTGAVTAQTNDYTWAQINKSTSSLADITTRLFSDLQSKPTTLSGYGITDAVPQSRTITINGVTFDLSANRTWTISGSGTGGISQLGVSPWGLIKENDSTYKIDSSQVATKSDVAALGHIAVDQTGPFKMADWDTDTLRIASLEAKSTDGSILIDTSASTQFHKVLDLKLNTLPNNSVGASQITNGSVGDAELGTGINANKLADGSVSNTELQYIGNLTSDAQTQLNNKITNQWTLQAAKFYVDSGRVANKMRYDAVQNIWLPIDSMGVISDSHGNGAGLTTIDSAAFKRLVDANGWLYNNYSVSSKGVWHLASVTNTSWDPGMSKITYVNVGFNDARRQTDVTKLKNKIYWAHNSIIANLFLKEYANAGGSGVTRTGTWSTPYPANTVGGKCTVGAYSSTTGSTMSYTAFGRYYVIQCIASDGSGTYNQGGFSYNVDGGSSTNFVMNGIYDGVSDGANDNGRGPAAIIIDAGSYGTHTIQLTVNIALVTPIDFIGVLKDPSETYPVFVVDAHYMDATGYATSPANATDAIMDSVNVTLGRMIADNWGAYKVMQVPVNTYFNVSTDLNADHIHTNDAGERSIYNNGLLPAYNAFLADTAHFQNGDEYRDYQRKYIWLGGVKKTYAFTSDIASGLSAGSQGTIQLSDGASGFSAATGLTSRPSANPGRMLQIVSAATTDTLILTKGFTSQTAPHQLVLSSTNAPLYQVSAGGGIQVLGSLSTPLGSGGLEIEYTGAQGYMTAYNRGGSSWVPLNLRGSTINFNLSGTNRLVISGANVTWTLGSDATGDTWYRNSSGFMTRLGIGSTGQFLGITAGVPAWKDLAATATYTPTLTNTTNISSSTAYTTYYIQVGDWIYVWGEFDATATTPLVASQMAISLPFSSDVVNSYDLSGVAIFSDNTVVKISGDATNNRAKLDFIPQTGTGNKYTFHFAYKYVAP